MNLKKGGNIKTMDLQITCL